ncbi:MAG: hypothetical protein ACHP93_03585 [Solirubrobacterales bacterium]
MSYERAVCWLGAVALAVLSEVVLGPRHLDVYLQANRYTVFGSLVAVCGALLGLVIAASALVLDRLAEGRLHLVQQSRHIHAVPAVFKSAMVVLGAATLVAILVLIPTGSAVADRILVYVWSLCALLVVARLARVIWLVGEMMRIVAAQESS